MKEGRDIPTPVPKSVAACTFIARLASTLPMSSTAWLRARWASCGLLGLGWFGLVGWRGVDVCTTLQTLCATHYTLSRPRFARRSRAVYTPPPDGGLRTLFKITSICPPASMTAFSPRSWTTFPSTRTILCWKVERCGARMRGVWGWSIFGSGLEMGLIGWVGVCVREVVS